MKEENSQSFRYYKSVIVLNRYFEKIGKLNLPGWGRPPNMFNGGSAAPLQSAYDSRSFCRETSYYSEKRVLFKLIAQKVKNALSSRDLHRNGSFYTLPTD